MLIFSDCHSPEFEPTVLPLKVEVFDTAKWPSPSIDMGDIGLGEPAEGDSMLAAIDVFFAFPDIFTTGSGVLEEPRKADLEIIATCDCFFLAFSDTFFKGSIFFTLVGSEAASGFACGFGGFVEVIPIKRSSAENNC